MVAPERMRRADSAVVQRRIWPPWTWVVRMVSEEVGERWGRGRCGGEEKKEERDAHV